MHVSNYDVNNYEVKISLGELLNVVVGVGVDHYEKGGERNRENFVNGV